MDKISDPGSFGVGVNIGNNGKYSVSVSVDRFDPDEAISDKYKCLILDDSVN